MIIRFAHLVIFCLSGFVLTSPYGYSQERPNIVLIMVDDMGFSDIGCYGSEIATPNLDRLAAEGVRFTQFYNTSRCCPTRASLLTGLYSHQAGMGLMIENRTDKPGFKGHLVRERCTTIAQVLKDAGYGTYMTGKWHLGNNPGEQPLDWGFDRFYGSLEGAISYFEPGNVKKYPHDKNPRPITLDRDTVKPDKDFYATNRFTDYAKLFLDQHLNERKEDPFFLYLAYNAPHWPLQALPQDIKKYEDKYLKGWDKLRKERYQRQSALGIFKAKNANLSERSDDRYKKEGAWPFTRGELPAWETFSREKQKDLAKRMAVYAAMVDNVDQNIGRLVTYLKDENKLDNTIIIFLSDNGGAIGGDVGGFSAMEPRDNLDLYGTTNSFVSYGLGWALASNTPFRMYKTYVHEGGISTPLIVHWPKGIKNAPGNFVRTPTHLIDVMPTLLEVAKAKYPETLNGNNIIPMEGQSIIPLIIDKSEKFNTDRRIYWEHAGCQAVRDKEWKLVKVHKGSWELYNIEEDRSEINNLISKYPERAKKMEKMYDVWADRAYVNPPMYE
ncbi:MAG: arylsulfatase [Daejeonella sp.]